MSYLVVAWTALSAAAVPAELQRLIDDTLSASPELSALSADRRSLELGADAAGAWPHPRLSVAYQNVPVDSWALGEEPMSMVQIRAEQTVLLPGKSVSRETPWRERARARASAKREHAVQVRARVTRAFYELALARQLRALTEQHIALLSQLEAAVRSKYEVGRAGQHDLIRIEIWRGRLADGLGDLGRRELELVGELNALAHRPLDAEIDTPAALDLPPPPPPLSDLVARAHVARPAFEQLEASAAAARASAGLARFEAAPDPTVFASYGLRKELPSGAGGRDLVTVGVSLPLPLFYDARNGATAEQRVAEARALERRREQLSDDIAVGLAKTRAAWARAREQTATYREALAPAARRAVDAALSAYRVDRADFASLFEAQVELLELETTIRSSTVRALNARAAVAALVGEDVQ